jgi:hypothetical protein
MGGQMEADKENTKVPFRSYKVRPWYFYYEVTFEEGGKWYDIGISKTDIVEVFRTGKLPYGPNIASIKISVGGVPLIYDFNTAKLFGLSPWRSAND